MGRLGELSLPYFGSRRNGGRFPMPDENHTDAIVIGGGPAGLRAAEILADGRTGASCSAKANRPWVGSFSSPDAAD